MKLIILDPRRGVSRTLNLPKHWHLVLAAVVLLLPLLGAMGGYWLFSSQSGDPILSGDVGRHAALAWRERIATQKQAVVDARVHAEEKLKAMTVRMAEMQARLLRLDALGERLARNVRVGGKEFDFSQPPAQGGPEDSNAVAFQPPDFLAALDSLAARIDSRDAELRVLESLLTGGRLREERFLAGNPVAYGYLSSTYGQRIDPFHGTLAFHRGVDFAGPEGADIVATGAGIVIFAGSHAGYGEMVEISHGDGISTVYAHARAVLVKVGEIVREGQVVAKLGNTGRSTGPHVHYEVRRNGEAINPAGFLVQAPKATGGG